jgi:hypothetical protein
MERVSPLESAALEKACRIHSDVKYLFICERACPMYSHKMPLYKYFLDEDLLRNTLVKLLGAFKRNECFSAIK